VNVFTGVSKGELGKDFENYFSRYGIEIDTGSRDYCQRRGQNLFRIMRSRDVPRLVGRGYDFGLTGKDCCEDEKLGGNGDFGYLDEFDFGKGELVLFGSSSGFPENPRVVTQPYYRNLAKKYSSELFGDFELDVVTGATEGFVASGEADAGFDCIFSGRTLDANGLRVREKVMDTSAVLISAPGYTMTDFEDTVLEGAVDFGKGGGLVTGVVQDYDTGEVLMVACLSRESLDITGETDLATFWSRSRKEIWTKGLTSGNCQDVVEIYRDCDGDALLLKVRPRGPACHTGEKSCFYRKLENNKGERA